MSEGLAALADRLRQGDPRALARAISMVEDRRDEARELLGLIYPGLHDVPIVGVTGPPGAGKSTLVDGLTQACRQQGKRVGVIAVDPSSTFSGGAVLGDRIRMQRHSTDSGVFIRSMATRGHFGGLARASVDAADLMAAAGCDIILIETVGVGQDEVDVVRVADVVLVVLVPGMGDDIQTIKAGIMEIPDLFVLNKADREGIERLHSDVTAMLSLMEGGSRRPAPGILRTVATDGRGIEELMTAIGSLLARPGGTGTLRRKERSRERLLDLMRERVREWAAGPESQGRFEAMVDRVAGRQIDPHTAADELMRSLTPPAGDRTLDHLGVAVRSLAGSLPFWRDRLGLEASAPEEVASEGVRVAFLPAGTTRIELLEPIGADSPIARFLEKRGEGIHHICLRVSDLEGTLAALEAAGARVLEPRVRIGAGGRRIAFIHPQSAGGVLLELKEHAP